MSADVVIDHTDPIAAYGSAWLVDSHTTPSGLGGSLIVPLFVDLVAFDSVAGVDAWLGRWLMTAWIGCG